MSRRRLRRSAARGRFGRLHRPLPEHVHGAQPRPPQLPRRLGCERPSRRPAGRSRARASRRQACGAERPPGRLHAGEPARRPAAGHLAGTGRRRARAAAAAAARQLARRDRGHAAAEGVAAGAAAGARPRRPDRHRPGQLPDRRLRPAEHGEHQPRLRRRRLGGELALCHQPVVRRLLRGPRLPRHPPAGEDGRGRGGLSGPAEGLRPHARPGHRAGALRGGQGHGPARLPPGR